MGCLQGDDILRVDLFREKFGVTGGNQALKGVALPIHLVHHQQAGASQQAAGIQGNAHGVQQILLLWSSSQGYERLPNLCLAVDFCLSLVAQADKLEGNQGPLALCVQAGLRGLYVDQYPTPPPQLELELALLLSILRTKKVLVGRIKELCQIQIDQVLPGNGSHLDYFRICRKQVVLLCIDHQSCDRKRFQQLVENMHAGLGAAAERKVR